MSENCHTAASFGKSPQIFLSFFAFFLIILSCNNKKEDSPFANILHQAPFAGLTDSIEHDRKNEELYFRRAVLLNSNNLPEPALADFQKAWSLKKDERFAIAISTLLLDKKPQEAIQFSEEALKILPQSTLLQLTKAHALQAAGQTDEAIAVCEQLLIKNPAQVDVLKLKADLLEQKGRGAEAIKTLEQAYTITPYDIELNYILALKYAETKNAKALVLCDSLIKVDSLDQHAEPNYYRGIYFSNLGNKQKALVEFNEAIRKDYYFLDSYIEKAAALYDLKQYPAAIKTLQLLLTISPKSADGYYWLGKCLEAAGDKEEANINYRKAIGLDATLSEARAGIERTK